MKYYGILDPEEINKIEDLTIGDIENVLHEKDIYHNVFSQETFEKLLKVNFTPDFEEIEIKTQFVPPIDLINEFNDFIYNTYKHKFIKSKSQYFTDFNETFYGYEYFDLRKVALEEFNEIYKSLNILQVSMVAESISVNGISHTHSTGKLFKLHTYHHQVKKKLATTENLTSYLTGDSSYYDATFFSESVETQDAMYIELMAQILVEINDKYQFEEDLYYSKKTSEAFKYKDFDTIFKNLKSYRFTNSTLVNYKNLKRSHIESLYQVLLEFDLITDNKKNFIDFIKDQYKFKLTKIATFIPKENLQNDKRVGALRQRWLNFDVPKSNLDLFFDF
ncbi:hypothetical protein [Flavobacterium sandaracinum]|uniref:Uncharacterized protein n=1 Tax=Flavobacterium sandaracinum TaxID=2541733 RepID=A0A4V2Z278_9FLAO|nr:hypothetical protein [Flavobacterium sandaracinum]TDE07838.1 hypothetical protein E0F91_01790 [Flavobacterium sandaracinum]